MSRLGRQICARCQGCSCSAGYGGVFVLSNEFAWLAPALAVALVSCVADPAPSAAADLGDSCCADLEERIAELEAITVRKGNRKVSLTVTGYVTKQVMFWN